MPLFRKIPVVIEAVQLSNEIQIQTLEGVMKGSPGDWLITGVKGEQYVCKDDIFQMTYEPAEPDPPGWKGPYKCSECTFEGADMGEVLTHKSEVHS